MRKLLLLCSMLVAAFTAGAQCSASFTAAQTPSGNNLLTVQFTNNTYYGLPFTGQRKLAKVNYGDGSSSATTVISIPSHTYSAPGVYLVGLRINSVDSASSTVVCSDTTTISVTVAYPPCGSTLVTSGTGATRLFSSSTPAGATGTTYSWNFGDGSTGTGTPISHTYATSGFYTITLVASKGAPTSCSYTNTVTIYVSVPPPALNCSTLHAAFTANVNSNVATISNTSSIVSGQYLSTASWTYGDGGTATGFNPAPHAYTAPGVYTIKLKMHWQDSLNTTHCDDSTTQTITILTIPTPPNVISGNIIYDTTAGYNYFKVYLIQFDSATNILAATDSMITAGGSNSYYAFGNMPAGMYRTKASLYSSATTGTGLIPTYHDSSIYWNSAAVINHTGGTTINNNIRMRTGTLSSGPGFIGGNVSLGANKGTANGGVAGMLILLRNNLMRVVAITMTDSNGNYSFPNIPRGAYSIYPEVLGYATIPVTPIQVTSTNPMVFSVSFTQDVAKRNILPRGTSVPGCICAPAGIYVLPVPASNKITITWNSMTDEKSQFIITSITGQEMGRSITVTGHAGSVEMNVSDMARGVYFIHGTGSAAGTVTKMVLQ